MPQPPDLELIRQVLQERSQRAFQLLVERHQPLVVNTCRGFLPCYQDAEDVAQEVFLEMYQSLGGFRGQAKLSTWLYRISVNKSLNYLRRAKRDRVFRRLEGIFSRADAPEPAPIAEDLAAPAPDRPMQEAQGRRAIRRAIAALPENQRIAFILNRYQDLSYQQVAEVMGVSVPAVESLLFRAKVNLQKRLARNL